MKLLLQNYKIKIVKDKGYKINFNEINIDNLSLGRGMAA